MNIITEFLIDKDIQYKYQISKILMYLKKSAISKIMYRNLVSIFELLLNKGSTLNHSCLKNVLKKFRFWSISGITCKTYVSKNDYYAISACDFSCLRSNVNTI